MPCWRHENHRDDGDFTAAVGAAGGGPTLGDEAPVGTAGDDERRTKTTTTAAAAAAAVATAAAAAAIKQTASRLPGAKQRRG